MKQAEHYERFLALHSQPGGFIMPNAWDGGSAVLLKQAGFAALGSTSLAIAFALGRQDGAGVVSREEALDNAALLSAVSDLPVNGDLEDGFGHDPEDCAATVEAAIARGLAGLGIEDTTANAEQPIHDFEHAVARVRRAAEAARGRIVLTGRTDNLLHGRNDIDDTIRRLVAFAEVGADVLYAPGLPDMAAIRAVIAAVAPKPVNVLLGPFDGFGQFAQLSQAGVHRVSTGGALYLHAMGSLADAASTLAGGNIAGAVTGISSSAIAQHLPKAIGR